MSSGRSEWPESRRRGRARRGRWAPLVGVVTVVVLWLAWLVMPDATVRALRLEVVEGADRLVEVAEQEPDGLPTSTSLAGEPLPTPESTEPPSLAASGEPTGSPTPEGDVAASAGPPGAGVDVPASGDGTFVVAPGGSARTGDGDLVRYTVEVERPLSFDPEAVAAIVDGVLADPRSWTALGEWSLERVSDPAQADARVLVTSPDTTDQLCAPLRTQGRFSCRNGDRVVLNGMRWSQGADTWGDDLVGYRVYLINHEFGHRLGWGHTTCPAPGAAAPVMMQQTISVGECVPNGWPYP